MLKKDQQEFNKAKQIVKDLKKQLKQKNQPHKDEVTFQP